MPTQEMPDFAQGLLGLAQQQKVSVTATTATTGALLGRFTQAQWPPPSPGDGNLAQYVDTNNNAAWLLVYTASTNLWTPYNGDTPASGYNETVLAVAGAGGPTNRGSFILGVAGTWLLDVGIGGFAAGGGSQIIAYLATTNTGTDIASAIVATGAYAKDTLATSFVATKGQTIYVNTTIGVGAGSTGIGLLTARFRPTSLANA